MAGPKTRRRFLEQRLKAMEADLEDAKQADGWTAVASLHKGIIAARKELDAELAKLETEDRTVPQTIEEEVAMLKKSCETWPDQLLVAVVEVYCARYKLQMPKPLRKVGVRRELDEDET